MNSRSATHFLVPLLGALAIGALVLLSVLGGREDHPPSALASVAAIPAEPLLSAEAYTVRLVGAGETLLSRRGGKRVAPASLTKLMTAIVAAEKLAAADTPVFSENAKTVEERRSPAKAGDAFGRDDLIRMALVASVNDAALALAEATGAKVGRLKYQDRMQAFVRLMNGKARILGLDDTHFENPTGLDAPGHYMSAADLARLAEYALSRHPLFWEMTRQSEAAVVSLGGSRYALSNTNELLKEFPALRGGKTGFTDNAKGALLLLYPVRPDRTAIIVILKSDDRFGDGRKIIEWLEKYGGRD